MCCAHRYLTNLALDPFERARHEDAMGYQRWWIEHMYSHRARLPPMSRQWLQSFKEFPPRQKPGSFNLRPRHGRGDGSFAS